MLGQCCAWQPAQRRARRASASSTACRWQDHDVSNSCRGRCRPAGSWRATLSAGLCRSTVRAAQAHAGPGPRMLGRARSGFCAAFRSFVQQPAGDLLDQEEAEDGDHHAPRSPAWWRPRAAGVTGASGRASRPCGPRPAPGGPQPPGGAGAAEPAPQAVGATARQWAARRGHGRIPDGGQAAAEAAYQPASDRARPGGAACEHLPRGRPPLPPRLRSRSLLGTPLIARLCCRAPPPG